MALIAALITVFCFVLIPFIIIGFCYSVADFSWQTFTVTMFGVLVLSGAIFALYRIWLFYPEVFN